MPKKKEVSKKPKKVTKKKEEKYKVVSAEKLRKVEFIVTSVIGIVFLVLLFLSTRKEIYIPATLITCALFLFSICYYYIEDESKKKFVYVLFGIGVLLIIAEVVYTLIKII